jgi:hypothetical protein
LEGAVTPERWGRVKALFHAALEKDPVDRAAFLKSSCGDDAEVRAEVQSLLESSEKKRHPNRPISGGKGSRGVV